jgi:hypothetical protein
MGWDREFYEDEPVGIQKSGYNSKFGTEIDDKPDPDTKKIISDPQKFHSIKARWHKRT